MTLMYTDQNFYKKIQTLNFQLAKYQNQFRYF